jgi:hypothetical protein
VTSTFSFLARSLTFGALSFWMPIVIVCAIFGDDWGVLLTFIPLTVILPIFVCLVQEVLARDLPELCATVGFAMIAGMWATGPFFMVLADTLSRAQGAPLAEAWSALGWETALFPITTFMISTYHGSLYAVLFATIALLLFSATDWSLLRLVRNYTLRR